MRIDRNIDGIKIGIAEKAMLFFLTLAVIGQQISQTVGTISMVLAIICFLYSFWNIYKNNELKKRIDNYKFYYLAIMIAAISFIPSLFGSIDVGVSIHKIIEIWIYRVLPFFMITICIKEKKLLLISLLTIIGFISLESLVAGYEVFIGDLIRAGGFNDNIMQFASILVTIMPISFIFTMDSSFNKKYRAFSLISSLCLIIGILANQTRGMWLALGVVLILSGLLSCLKSKKNIIFSLLIMIFASGLYFQPSVNMRINTIINMQDENSYQARIYLWEKAFKMGKNNLINGVGIGNFSKVLIEEDGNKKWNQLPHAHNEYLNIWAEGGIIAFIGYSIMAIYFLFKNLVDYLTYKDKYSLMIFASWLAILLFGITETCFDKSTIRLWWYLLGNILVLKYTINSYSKG